MKYDPDKHHRRSIRLKGYNYCQSGAYFITICTHQRECLFGEIVDSTMVLNCFGRMVWTHWKKLPNYHPRLKLDQFVVMPNHVHGILILMDAPNCGVGAGLIDSPSVGSDKLTTKPAPTDEFTETQTPTRSHGIPEIIRGFKTFSSRRINQIRRMAGVPVWQRNYYEHIIRHEASLQRIREYILSNPQSWKLDQLYPDNLSNW